MPLLMQNMPAFDLSSIAQLDGFGTDELVIEAQLADLPHLECDVSESIAGTEARTLDARRMLDAASSIGRLPGPTESLHLVISGRFALWDAVPASLSLAGHDITDLHVCTLGFSKLNVMAAMALVDAGKIGRLSLLCSMYFRGTSQGVFELAENELGKRQSCRMLAARTHAKMLAMRFTDGRTLIVESSANLRSCKNIEQMSLFGSPALYRFHTGWIDDLFEAGANRKDRG